MIEIASPATPQLSSLLPPPRRRSPNDAPGASREHSRPKNMIPLPTEHSLAILYPAIDALPTRGFLPWRFSNAGPVSADSNGQ
jgi:hypothetical protein